MHVTESYNRPVGNWKVERQQTMKQITLDVFSFSELSDDAKQVAREWYLSVATHDEWWESTFKDAERIGLKIESFGLDRDRHATGKWITSARECATPTGMLKFS